jgi:hypothetical protein
MFSSPAPPIRVSAISAIERATPARDLDMFVSPVDGR